MWMCYGIDGIVSSVQVPLQLHNFDLFYAINFLSSATLMFSSKDALVHLSMLSMCCIMGHPLLLFPASFWECITYKIGPIMSKPCHRGATYSWLSLFTTRLNCRETIGSRPCSVHCPDYAMYTLTTRCRPSESLNADTCMVSSFGVYAPWRHLVFRHASVMTAVVIGWWGRYSIYLPVHYRRIKSLLFWDGTPFWDFFAA